LIETLAVKTAKSPSRNSEIAIELSGVCDIFEVGELKTKFAKAFEAVGVKKINVNCANLVRLDTSTAQLIASLTSSAATCGKIVQITNIPPHVAKYLAKGGLQF